MGQRIKIRRDTLANWMALNPVLQDGEIAYETTNKQLRVGDGVTQFSSLPRFLRKLRGTNLELVVASGASKLQAHGLGVTPTYVQAYYECVVAVADFTIGERFSIPLSASTATIRYDATNIYVKYGTTVNYAAMPTKADPNVTQSIAIATNFKLVVIPFYEGY